MKHISAPVSDGQNQTWTQVIRPKRAWFDLRLAELWRYRYLVRMFVRRDLVAGHKQTILGPAWIIIPPLITSVVFTVIFGNIANLSTDGAPQLLFYMGGVMMWGFFNACVVGNANTFMSQAGMFSKVYFPRMVVPLANVVSTTISSCIQLIIFTGFLLYYVQGNANVRPNVAVLLLPVLFFISAALGLGVGTLASAITAKYRDLSFLLTYGMQLWMFATTVIYPLSSVPEKYRSLALLNPLTPVVETFRYGFLGTGEIPIGALVAALILAIFALFVGLVVFSRIEQTAMDTI